IDYHYPLGGTGIFPAKLVSFIEDHHGEIRTNTKISSLDPTRKVLTDEKGNLLEFERLIWAADLKTLYEILSPADVPDNKVSQSITTRQEELRGKNGNDSVYSLFLGLDLPKEYFSRIATEHFFYTPSKAGQTQAGEMPSTAERESVKEWLD